MSFFFEGEIPASKSLFNRWLCIGSYAPKALQIRGDSHCEDVLAMKRCLRALESGAEMDCGAAGTVLRFMALRASRKVGTSVLHGTTRLFNRPQSELGDLFQQLQVSSEWGADFLRVTSSGWVLPPHPLQVDLSRSSQFASAVLLNAWDLPQDLEVDLSESSVSDSYLEMTLKVVIQAGLPVITEISGQKRRFKIKARAPVRSQVVDVEPDMSSAFAVAALGAVGGRAYLKNFPQESLQPDFCFVDVMKRLGFSVENTDQVLKCSPGTSWASLEVDLKNAPDLFPVLSVLCALSPRSSLLKGARHLVHKESNRIAGIAQLLRGMGRAFEETEEGMKFSEQTPPSPSSCRPWRFDPDQDHRLVMAAAVLRAAGYPIALTEVECVRKSYPEFLDILSQLGLS